jgi:anti-anti-sigma factor
MEIEAYGYRCTWVLKGEMHPDLPAPGDDRSPQALGHPHSGRTAQGLAAMLTANCCEITSRLEFFAMPDLTVQSDVFDDVTRLNVGGELDAWSCDGLVDAVECASALNGRRITIDLAKLTFIDSFGVRALLTLREELGDRLALGCLSPQAHRILELTGVLTTFPRDPSIDDSIQRG